jgi:hypothetical protein
MDFAIPESTQRMARVIRDFMHADEGPSPSYLRRIETGPVGL